MSLIEKIIDLLEKHLPWFFGGYKIGKDSSNKEVNSLKASIVKLKLRIKKARYEQKVKDRNSKLSDSELADEINSNGRGKK